MDQAPNEEVLSVEPEEIGLATVPVDIKGPVRTQELPAHTSGSRSYSFLATDTGARKVLNEDPRRKRALLIGTAIFRFGFSQQEADASIAGTWPLGVPLELTTEDQVWARPDSGAATITIVSEQWTD